jgi:2-C-methyl-D-erythritol 4-phosphate cytidylyltransferase / 2-C-methyl-D-erythritol 2,4-cyclodiphosphate synthase
MFKATNKITCSAVIVAGGQGKRMGKPKQMLKICDKAVLLHSIDAFLKVSGVRETVVVTTANVISKHKKEFLARKVKTVLGGNTRLESVRKGVAALEKQTDVVAVHDGARPLVSSRAIKDCIVKAYKKGAAVLAVPAKDTVKEASKNLDVKKTLERGFLWLAQTPQCYKREVITKALERFKKIKEASDESQLVERAGTKVAIVPSDYKNIKITTPEDLLVAEALMSDKSKKEGKLRVGFGYDLHRMVTGRDLILGGFKIEHTKGLLGHSDGDVVLHAVCDAVLGALCEGEIGMFFPPTDLTIMGISSVVIAQKTMEVVKKRKAEIRQMDVTVMAEEPKLITYYNDIRKSLCEIFKMSLNDVSVKAKSQEGLGRIGRGEAAACCAVVTLNVYE